MSITRVQGTSSTTSSTSSASLAFASNVTANNLLVVDASTNGNVSALTVSDSQSNTYTLQNDGNTLKGAPRQWTAYAGSSAANTVTVSGTGTGQIIIQISEYSGTASSSPSDGTNNANSNTNVTTLTTGTIATTQAGDLLHALGCVPGAAATPWTAGNDGNSHNYSITNATQGKSAVEDCSPGVTETASASISWTGSQTGAMLLLAIKPAASSGIPNAQFIYLTAVKRAANW